jgi:hypothetical protein
MSSETQFRFDRRTALRTISGITLAGLAGCAGRTGNGGTDDEQTGTDGLVAAVEGSALVATFEADALDQLNVIQPDGELYAKREIATGVTQVSVEIGTSYQPGEFRVVGIADGDVVDEVLLDVRPSIEIVDVGLYRNHPEKPWDEVYGDSDTDRKKNAEAFVTVRNSGSGPDRIDRLRFRGDVPFSAEEYDGSGVFNSEDSVVFSGERSDLYSDVLPFGYYDGSDGLGCVIEGVDGQFTVAVEARVSKEPVEKSFHVTYSGSDQMSDCEIVLEEA